MGSMPLVTPQPSNRCIAPERVRRQRFTGSSFSLACEGVHGAADTIKKAQLCGERPAGASVHDEVDVHPGMCAVCAGVTRQTAGEVACGRRHAQRMLTCGRVTWPTLPHVTLTYAAHIRCANCCPHQPFSARLYVATYILVAAANRLAATALSRRQSRTKSAAQGASQTITQPSVMHGVPIGPIGYTLHASS